LRQITNLVELNVNFNQLIDLDGI